MITYWRDLHLKKGMYIAAALLLDGTVQRIYKVKKVDKSEILLENIPTGLSKGENIITAKTYWIIHKNYFVKILSDEDVLQLQMEL
jgi:hypothetical protein